MRPYMIDRGEKGINVQFYDLDHARESILARDPDEAAGLAGVNFDAGRSEFTFKSLGQDITVSYPECRARFTETGETPKLDWHMTLLHHLSTADGAALSGKWIAVREISEAHPQQFESQTNDDLVKKLADKPIDTVEKVALALGADIQKGNADLNAVFYFLPRFPILVQLWLNEERIPGSGKVLFDSRCTHYLPSMDAYKSGELVVEFVIAQYQLMFA